jgi:hypothetical protein
MIGRRRRGSKKQTEAQPPVEAKSAPTPKAPKGTSRPGFFDTFRSGWDMPSLKLAGSKAVATGAAARTSSPAAKRQRRPTDGVPAQPVTRPELAKQRDRLARQFAELQWDLGGIAYEMASRDHFRMDVLVKQAAKLQEVDAQLGQVERVLRLEQEGAAGTCPHCGGLQARGAIFCWQCGKELKQPTKPKAAETKQSQPATSEKPAAPAKTAGDKAPAAKPEKT